MAQVMVHADEPVRGTPLVLLHAFPFDSRMWRPVIDLLPNVDVVCVDAPGFGGSSPAEPGLESYALEVVAAVRELGVEQAVVAGLSMGGYVAMAIAEAAPGLLAGIGLLSTKASADAEQARENRMAMVAAVERGEQAVALDMLPSLLGPTTRATRPAVVDQVETWLRDAPAPGLAWAQRSMAARPDRLKALRDLPDGVPSLVVRGTEDSLMSGDDAAAMAAALGTSLTQVLGAGHLVALEDPDATAAALEGLHGRATISG